MAEAEPGSQEHRRLARQRESPEQQAVCPGRGWGYCRGVEVQGNTYLCVSVFQTVALLIELFCGLTFHLSE